MIKYIKRRDLDIIKYDTCIDNSIQSRVYAFSWYLDIVADNWDSLVLNDYEAVMPIPWRRKIGIKYIYPPFWLLELGFFSIDKKIDYQSFLNILIKEFRYVETRLNTDNFISTSSFLIDKKMQVLATNDDYSSILNNYRKDRKKDLRKAQKADLTEKWNDDTDKLIQLFKNNVGQRTPYIKEKDYKILEKLMDLCIKKRVGEVLSIYNRDNDLIASGFFLKHKKTVTILVSSTDFKNRNNGANTFLIDRAIYKYHKNYELFHFGGSSMESIAKYFLSFGSATKLYHQIKYNNLPKIVKFFRR